MEGKTSSRLRCALVQADTIWADASANYDNLSGLMDQAPGCDLYVLPETCTTGFLGDAGHLDEASSAGDITWLRESARRRSAAIAAGIVAIEDGKIFNRFVLARPDGESSSYDKRHLFGFGGEDRRYTAGSRRLRTEWMGWRIDLQVCYDLRFPVWCRNDDAFDLQIFVANWPRPRVGAWSTLLKARAIENQACVIGVNRAGTDGNGVQYPGCSGAWNAEGACLFQADDRQRVDCVEFDLEQLGETRSKFPFLADRDGFELEDEAIR